jgi:cytochrome c nitrite reductase small subunit
MWPYRDTWQKSSHKDADCVQCHIPPGTVNFVETKFYASREVWVHFTGQVKAPIKVTRHIPDSACLRSGCHAAARLDKTLDLGAPATVTFRHGDGHAGQLCISCHASLVHAGAPGVTAPPPNSMEACFSCHSDGTRDCAYCHEAPHADRGPCVDCHSINGWSGKGGPHPGGRLTGKHGQISCESCHTKGVNMAPDGCIDCHGDHHNGLTDCVQCHTIHDRDPSKFTQPQE